MSSSGLVTNQGQQVHQGFQSTVACKNSSPALLSLLIFQEKLKIKIFYDISYFLNIGNYFFFCHIIFWPNETSLNEAFRKSVSLSELEGLYRSKAQIKVGRQSIKLEMPLTEYIDTVSTREYKSSFQGYCYGLNVCASPPPNRYGRALNLM